MLGRIEPVKEERHERPGSAMCRRGRGGDQLNGVRANEKFFKKGFNLALVKVRTSDVFDAHSEKAKTTSSD
ncbi:hypothetical protein Csa_008365, partial [Cucumis sativus]